MSPLKKLAGQTATYGMSSIIGRFLNYLLVPIYTREFLPAEYGIVTELYAYVALLIIILLLGMETAFFRFTKEAENEKVYSTTFFTILGSSLFFLVAVLFSSESIAAALHMPDHEEYIQWFAYVIALDVITSIPFALLREEGKAKLFVVIKFLNIGINIALNLFFIVLCKNVYEAGPDNEWYNWVSKIYDPSIGVGYIFIANLVASASALLFLAPQLFRVSFIFDFSLWKRMLKYSLPLLVLGVAGIINETLDRILLEHLLPLSPEDRKAEIGIYGACYKLSIIMTLAIQAFRYAAEPFFFAEAKKEDAKKTYAAIMKYFVIIMSVIFLGTLLYLDIVKYFIGENFHSGLHIVPILLLANLFLGIYYNLSVWYKLTDRTHLGMYISIGGAILTIILNILWIPVLGYTGSAWATLACYFSMAVGSFLWGQRFYPIKYNLKKILGYIVLAIIIYQSSLYLEGFLEKTLMINTFLMLLFLLIIIILEGRDFKRVMRS